MWLDSLWRKIYQGQCSMHSWWAKGLPFLSGHNENWNVILQEFQSPDVTTSEPLRLRVYLETETLIGPHLFCFLISPIIIIFSASIFLFMIYFSSPPSRIPTPKLSVCAQTCVRACVCVYVFYRPSAIIPQSAGSHLGRLERYLTEKASAVGILFRTWAQRDAALLFHWARTVADDL